MLQFIAHYGMHFIAPGFIAYFFFKDKWIKVYLIFVLTVLIDVDHLFADPLFDPDRCSINCHPLHTHYAMMVYVLMLIPNKTRVIAIGLLFHMLTDFIDCLW